MATPWEIIETTPEAAAALSWRRWFGPALDAAAVACLRETRRPLERIPCGCGCACNHRVRKRGTALVGVCDCGEDCDDVALTDAEVIVWKFDLPRLGRAVATALNCRAMVAPIGFHRTIQVTALGNPALPVVLTCQPDADHYRNAVAHLLARLPDGFILLTPTKLGDASTLELLTKARRGFYDLESNFHLMPSGKLHSPKSAEVLFAAHLPNEAIQRGGREQLATGNIFCKAGSHWDVTFDGSRMFHLPHTLGAEYLNYLLHHPSQPISAYDLEMTIRPDKAKARPKDTVQNNLDGDAIQDYLRQLNALRGQRDEAAEDGDLAKVDKLDGDIEAIETELKKNGQAPDVGERSRGNVGKAVAAVQRKLRRGGDCEKALGRHIEQFVSMGYECCYNQPQEKRWG